MSHSEANDKLPPSTSVFLLTRRTPAVSSRVGSTLPLPLYADVRLHIPMTHRTDVIRYDATSLFAHLDKDSKGFVTVLQFLKGMVKLAFNDFHHKSSVVFTRKSLHGTPIKPRWDPTTGASPYVERHIIDDSPTSEFFWLKLEDTEEPTPFEEGVGSTAISVLSEVNLINYFQS